MIGARAVLLAIVLTPLGACSGTDRNADVARVAAPRAELSGPELYDTLCADCHRAPGQTKAPSLSAMKALSVASIMFSMVNGTMRTEATDLSLDEKIRVSAYVAGVEDAYRPEPAAMCGRPDIDLARQYVSRWGLDPHNTAAVGPDVSAITARNVDRLELKWAFGLPHSADARSQPVITTDTLFVAAVGGDLFALDRFTGCIKWHFSAPAPLRTALTLGSIRGGGADRPVLFFGDAEAAANAVDARTGEPVWRTDVAVAEHSILTGAPIQHADQLIVPVSMYEVALARDPDYECCKSHGAVHSLDVNTGTVRWTTHLTADAEPRGLTSAGTRRWGPSGVPVWSTPTVDATRGVVYVGTGQNASAPATDFSDSVLALALETGAIVWHFQALAGDTYNDGCSSFPTGPNCPSWAGPDFDIGASIALTKNSTGKEVLVVGQKSGDVYTLDPDDAGRMVWQQRVGSGSPLGGVHWGVAVADGVVFAPVADPEFLMPGYAPKPGLYALAIDSGDIVWEHPIERGCATNLGEYFDREVLYPECSFYYGLSAAPTVVRDVVFAPGLDGRVRAFATKDGSELWQFETARPFDTMNGVEAHGGSIDSAGVQVAGRMIYVQSGYSLFGQLPGNVLLAFELPARRDASPVF